MDKPAGKTVYRFAEFELDPAAFTLRRHEEIRQVEPKVLELLICLISAEGRLIGKEELLRTLWPGRHVTESALTRCVYEARRALGENSRDATFVRTVHGRGYRFGGEIEQGSPIVPTVAVRTVAEPAKDPPVAAPPVETRRRAWIWLPMVLLLALAVWLKGAAPEEVPLQQAPTSAAHPSFARVALLPLSTDGNDELGLLALSMTDLLNQRLEELPEIVLRSLDYSAEVFAADQPPHELARLAGVELLIAGRLEPATESGRVLLTVELHAASSRQSTPLGTYELPSLDGSADLAAFVRTRDVVVRRMVDLIVPALTIPEAPHLTDDPEAYRAYLLGFKSLLESFCDGGIAIEMATRALERDSEFVQAWLLLSAAHYNAVWACGESGSHFAEALAAADRAHELAPDLVIAQLARVTISVETGRVEEALEIVRDIGDRNPNHSAAREARIYCLRYAGYLRQAEEHLRVLLIADPLFYSTAWEGEAPNTLLYLNRLDEYLRHLPAIDTPYHRFYRGLTETLRGNKKVAREVLEPAFRANPADLFARLSHALLAILEGDLEVGGIVVRQIALQRQELGANDGEITYKQAQLLTMAGDLEGGLENLGLAVDQGFFPVTYFETDPLLDPLRELPAFEAILTRASARHRKFGERFGLTPET